MRRHGELSEYPRALFTMHVSCTGLVGNLLVSAPRDLLYLEVHAYYLRPYLPT